MNVRAVKTTKTAVLIQTMEDRDQSNRQFWDPWLAEFERQQKRVEYWKAINKEWDEFNALGLNADGATLITAMKIINKKIRMVEKI